MLPAEVRRDLIGMLDPPEARCELRRISPRIESLDQYIEAVINSELAQGGLIASGPKAGESTVVRGSEATSCFAEWDAFCVDLATEMCRG